MAIIIVFAIANVIIVI